MKQNRSLALLLFFNVLTVIPLAAETNNDVTNEWKVTALPYFPIRGNLNGFGYISWSKNPDNEYSRYTLAAPGFIYQVKPWFQLWTGMINNYTHNNTSENGKPDTLELRPFIGPKFILHNQLKWNIYNFTRFEFREIYSYGTHSWSNIERVRSRFGIEAPLTHRENAWKAKTFYGTANFEPIYRFDKGEIDPFRVQFGLGYVASSKMRLEFIYNIKWGRNSTNALVYDQNTFRLNINIGLKHGLLSRVLTPAADQ